MLPKPLATSLRRRPELPRRHRRRRTPPTSPEPLAAHVATFTLTVPRTAPPPPRHCSEPIGSPRRPGRPAEAEPPAAARSAGSTCDSGFRYAQGSALRGRFSAVGHRRPGAVAARCTNEPDGPPASECQCTARAAAGLGASGAQRRICGPIGLLLILLSAGRRRHSPHSTLPQGAAHRPGLRGPRADEGEPRRRGRCAARGSPSREPLRAPPRPAPFSSQPPGCARRGTINALGAVAAGRSLTGRVHLRARAGRHSPRRCRAVVGR